MLFPGYTAICADFNQLVSVDRVDVISMADVLEHMPYPKTSLQHAAGLLRPGGLIFVSMPNSDSLSWRYLFLTLFMFIFDCRLQSV